MKTIDVVDIAKDLARACGYYVEDALKDRLSGVIRSVMVVSLERRGMSDVVEFVEPAQVFVDAADNSGRLTMRIGDTNLDVTRQVTLKQSDDVDDIRARPEQFVEKVTAEVARYVSSLPVSTRGVTVPALYVGVKAYMVTWLLWGYVATLNAESEASQ
jgi:hypothetical protein